MVSPLFRFSLLSSVLLIILVTLCLLQVGPTEGVEARVLWVPDEYDTIQEAVDDASDGDSVRVGDGVFVGSVLIDKPISVIGNGSVSTDVAADNGRFVFYLTGSGIKLAGFYLVGGMVTVGVHLHGADNCTVEDVKSIAKGRGFYLNASSHNIIRNCEMRANEIGLMMENGSDFNIVENLTSHINTIGLVLGPEATGSPSDHNYLGNSTFTGDIQAGSIGPYARYTTLHKCQIDNSSSSGFESRGAHTRFSECNVFDNRRTGIFLNESATSSVIDGCAFIDNGDGVRIEGADRSTIVNCTFRKDHSPGLMVTRSNHTNVVNCSFDDNYGAIYIWEDSPNNLIEDCIFVDCSNAVSIKFDCNNTRVTDCEFLENRKGIWAFRTSDLFIDNCTFDANEDHGLMVGHCSRVEVRACTATGTTAGNGFYFYFSEGPFLVEECKLSENAWNGIYVDCALTRDTSAFELRSCEILNNSLSGVVVNACKNFIVQGNTIMGNGAKGLSIREATNGTFAENLVSGNEYGFRFTSCNRCTIENNTVLLNSRVGIYLGQSGNLDLNHVINNVITGNGHGHTDGAGIAFWGNLSRKNHIELNELINNSIGVLFESNFSGSYGNLIRFNTIRGCSRAALSTVGSGPNTVYLNNFVNNTVQVESPHADDAFDSGALGNYWDDYLQHYPNAEVVGMVWDTPYEVLTGSEVFDRYPLAHEYDGSLPIADAGGDRTELAGEIIELDASASFSISPIKGYLWNITDPYGNFESIPTEDHLLLLKLMYPGAHTITMTVYDILGEQASTSVTITAMDINRPRADPGGNYTVPMTVEFTLDGSASSDDFGIVSYEWTILTEGGMRTFLGVHVNLTFDLPWTTHGYLNVTDTVGNWDIEHFYLFIIDDIPPVADAGPDMTVDSGERYELNGSRSYDNVEVWYWQWWIKHDDSLNQAITGMVRTLRTYDEGVYNVTLTVSDEHGNEAVDHMILTVMDTIDPVARAGGTITVVPGETVILDAGDSTDNGEITSYTWRFLYMGEAIVLEGSLVTYIFDEIGSVPVTLTVIDAAGNDGVVTINVTVLDTIAPIARILQLSEIRSGETMVLDGTTSSDNIDIVSYLWIIEGNGEFTNLTGPIVEIIFHKSGSYDVTLEVKDGAGNVDASSIMVKVVSTEFWGGGIPAWAWVVIIVALLSAIASVMWYRGSRK